ncbi:MAG: hypothetical protein CMK59_09480 [Proteobacteria bacterium]|nr:hypothetical protein [Pseudomonadota bacterium]
MREELLARIAKKGDIPPLPATIQRLKEMINDPNSGINEVAQVIQRDPILSGRLIQLANSVYFSGRGFAVTSLPRAIGRLGLKMALDITYSVELPKVFSKVSIINQEDFWKYSTALAIASSSITKKYRGNRDEISYSYLSGLMYNVGILIFVNYIPDEYSECIKEINNDSLPRNDVELDHFNIDSIELGSAFIEKWWPVAPEVIELIRTRPVSLKPTLKHSTYIAEKVLNSMEISNGVNLSNEDNNLDFLYDLDFTQEDILELKQEIINSINGI